MTCKPQLFTSPPSDFGPSLHVASCYITSKGKLLLLQTAPQKAYGGSWSAPGGKLESLETPLAGALRETFEETGLRLDAQEVHHHTTFFVRYPDFDFIYHVFVLELPTPPQDIVLSPREHTAYIWITPEQIDSLVLMPAAKECFQHIYNGTFIIKR
jgi:8-oxo-dGTP diphosphatase